MSDPCKSITLYERKHTGIIAIFDIIMHILLTFQICVW